MSANMDVANALAGLDEADATQGRFPHLAEDGEHLVEVTETRLFQSAKDESTLVWLQEVVVVESTNPAEIGKQRVDMIHDIKGKNKKLKMGQLKSQIAAILGYGADTEQKWIQIASQMAEKNAVRGFRYKVKCGRLTQSKSGARFIPRDWETPAPGQLGERQAALFAKRGA